jgi:predicted ATP-grasp superfamily ATP-dependent carboligase/protein-tyrosine-phosphatase
LILGTEPRIAITIARSLHQRSIPVDAAALSPHDPWLASRAVRNVFRLPSPRHAPQAFIAALCQRIRAEQFDMLIPCSDSALTAIAQHYQHLSGLLHLGCPSPHIVQRVLDKHSTLEIAQHSGIPIPATCLVSDAAELQAVGNTLRFPMIAKPRSKVTGGAFKVRSFQTFQELQDMFAADSQFGSRHLLQEYCPGEGVGVEVLIHHGEPVAMLQHRRLKELPSTGGVSVLATSEALDPTLAQHALTLLRRLAWEGVAMVEFRYNRANRTAVLMEVNGRYWGSLALALYAGIDFPFYEWQLAHGELPHIPPSYQTGVRMRWTSGDMRRVHSLFTEKHDAVTRRCRGAELMRFITDFLPPTHDALWSVVDPVPAVCELGCTVTGLALSDLKRMIKSILPRSIVNLVEVYRKLDRPAGAAYVKRQCLRALGLRRERWRQVAAGVRSILFVCQGNLIRSPMAAALLRQRLSMAEQRPLTIVSAGLHAKPTNGADARALMVAKEFGVSLDEHCPQLLTPQQVEQAEVIFVMDFLTEAVLLGLYPQARHKVVLLGAHAEGGPAHELEIADPYHGEMTDIRRCYSILDCCIQHLVDVLFPPHCDNAELSPGKGKK